MKIIACLFAVMFGLSAVAKDQGYLWGTNTLELAESESLVVLCIMSKYVSDGPTSISIKLTFPPSDGPTTRNVLILSDTDLAGRTILGPCTISNAFINYGFGYKINKAPVFTSPMNVITLPAENDGDVDVLVETSADLETWTPVYSGSAGTSNSASFVRTRLVKKKQ